LSYEIQKSFGLAGGHDQAIVWEVMKASTAAVPDLIYDVGMHNGDDTAFYLHQGFRVIGIEADPQLADLARRKFSTEVGSGRLTILNVGIAERTGTGTFWICDGKSVWNSFHEKLACRVGQQYHSIEIHTQRFCEILDEYGVPFYLKVDIEGSDYLCLRDLAGGPLPRFISVEAECIGDDDDLTNGEPLANLSLLSLLSKKGSKKELTKRAPFLVKSLVCKSSEKTVNGG